MTREEAINIMNVIIHMLEPQYDNDRVEEAVDMAIKALEQEPEWIPTSKRLPESVGMYLVTLEYKEHGKAVTTLWYHGDGIGWDLRVADVVVAWMPLLEPYEEGGAKECKALSEWQQDHAILKAHADGANEVIDRVKQAREEISKSCYKACITDDGVIRESKILEILDKLIAEVEG